MTSVARMRNQLINHAITTDAQFVGRFIGSLQQPGVQPVGPVASFCLSSYLSLFVHESYCRLKTLHPALAVSLSSDARTIIARSRHSLKFFEDTQRGLAGQVAYFRDEIIDTRKARFLGMVSAGQVLGNRFGTLSIQGRTDLINPRRNVCSGL